MASPSTDKQRAEPQPIFTDEKADRGSSSPTLYDEDENDNATSPVDTVPKDGAEEYVSGWKLISLMISITMAAFLMLLDMSIITTAIPRITEQFHSLDDIGWYGASYNLASAALQPLSGKLYTYFKSKWLFLGFLFIFEVGCLICGVATSSIMLIIGRTVAGMGSSGIQNGAFTIIAASTPLEKRPALVGVLMAGAQLGLVIGPLVGGALTEYTTWRWCFYINLPIGALCTVLILLVDVPDRVVHTDEPIIKTLRTKLDLTGFVIFAPCTIMFLLALQWGGLDYSWDSATVIGLFCGGGATLFIFILWEYRVGDGAMIPLPVVRKREVWTSCLTMMFLFTSVFVASYYLPIYFQSVKGDTPFQSGVNLLPSILSQIVAAVFIGVIGSAAVLAIASGLLTTLSPHTSTAKWAGFQVLLGFGRGIGMQMPIIAIQASTPPALTSIATAVLVFSQTFGGAVFVSIANVIFNNKLKGELTARLPHIDANMIIEAGATAALAAYAKGVDFVFYLSVAAGCAMFLTSWGMGWKDIRKKDYPLRDNMNRPRNRQQKPPRQNQRGPPRGGRGAPSTPQQATGTVPTVQQVVPGACVFIILKEDQPTGEETKGIVQDLLTRGNHPRGIKVRLQDGQVGRVQRMGEGSAPTARSAPATAGSAGPAASSSRFSNRYTDVRYDEEFPECPPPRGLADFMPELDSPPRASPGGGDVASSVVTVNCPFCEEFEGDEVATTHHIEQKHLT
ncbi:major facilitator superfamily domain-containing protein [Ilyonectria robusta]|uniref:major facilitator superfamily domain-containing protein n=1 Tax=Ilyonectria robusta TaxID=1079257 RepID=UPI001E8D5BCF|nr:major facilitator superfamily domain-containing protein [Ilyonectria robusta]KAH8686944.1 major facilitator superfamily domain-containing protein [Ilyonectria robusta]